MNHEEPDHRSEIVFLHGLGETPAVWEPIIGLLPAGYSCRAVDLFSSDLVSGDLEDGEPSGHDSRGWSLTTTTDSIASSISSPVHIVGLSLGAVVGLDLAIRYPKLVESLFLSAPQVRMPRRLFQLQNSIMRLLPEKIVCPPGLTKAQLLAVLDSLADLDLTSALGLITAPTTVVCGSKDRAKHQWHADMPDAFAAKLVRHLDETS